MWNLSNILTQTGFLLVRSKINDTFIKTKQNKTLGFPNEPGNISKTQFLRQNKRYRPKQKREEKGTRSWMGFKCTSLGHSNNFVTLEEIYWFIPILNIFSHELTLSHIV